MAGTTEPSFAFCDRNLVQSRAVAVVLLDRGGVERVKARSHPPRRRAKRTISTPSMEAMRCFTSTATAGRHVAHHHIGVRDGLVELLRRHDVDRRGRLRARGR